MLSKIVLWVILVVPWVTLFFLKKEQVKRFMSAGILVTTIWVFDII